jgi:hypothetical protein
VDAECANTLRPLAARKATIVTRDERADRLRVPKSFDGRWMLDGASVAGILAPFRAVGEWIRIDSFACKRPFVVGTKSFVLDATSAFRLLECNHQRGPHTTFVRVFVAIDTKAQRDSFIFATCLVTNAPSARLLDASLLSPRASETIHEHHAIAA